MVNPRIMTLEQPHTFSPIVANTAGISLFIDFFKDDKHDEILISGPLTAIASCIAALAGELLTRSQKMNMIDLSRAKIFVFEERKFRSILLASKYEDGLSNKLKRFTEEFVEENHESISGDIRSGSINADHLIERYDSNL